MNNKVIDIAVQKAVTELQCPGCAFGPFPSCYEKYMDGIGCGKHRAGTMAITGTFMLGMPKGFDRLGVLTHPQMSHMPPVTIYQNLAQLNRIEAKATVASLKKGTGWYNRFNVPVWKHRTESGYVLVKGLQPRLNSPFVHAFLDMTTDEFKNIKCQEITTAMSEEMD